MRISVVYLFLFVLGCRQISTGAQEAAVDETQDVRTEEVTEEGTGQDQDQEVADGEEDVQDLDNDNALNETSDNDSALNSTSDSDAESQEAQEAEKAPAQSGPFIDLLGPSLLSLQMIDETHAQLGEKYTNEALSGKSVVGLYFSADWCGPCRQFTPELVQFYSKMNSRRGKENKFEIVWISRCRDLDSFAQYFTHMNWLALPPQEAMGQRGQALSDKYRVKGIPTLVLLDEVGNVITTDARNKIPQDKAGIGFPWRNPLSTLYMTVIPRSLRLMVKSQVSGLRDKLMSRIKAMVPFAS